MLVPIFFCGKVGSVMQYADISELDDKALYVRVTWNKMINYASTFTREFLAVEQVFKSGKYGPEWTFARWLGVKCGMSHSTTYRMIQELHRVATDDEREKIKMVVADQQRAKHQRKADSRAAQLAWDSWSREEKDRIADEKAATQQAKKKEQKRAATNARQRKHRRDEKAKKAKENKDLQRVTLSDEKRVSEVRQSEAVDKALNQLMIVLSKLPKDDLVVFVERIINRLQSLVPSNNDEVHVNGHNTEQTYPESTSV